MPVFITLTQVKIAYACVYNPNPLIQAQVPKDLVCPEIQCGLQHNTNIHFQPLTRIPKITKRGASDFMNTLYIRTHCIGSGYCRTTMSLSVDSGPRLNCQILKQILRFLLVIMSRRTLVQCLRLCTNSHV
uniref:Uncharacterized protein n=1 Tax=Cacopsylla melanoneura TaxID=428564 RepID=A0A8D9AZF2_9HEMI